MADLLRARDQTRAIRGGAVDAVGCDDSAHGVGGCMREGGRVCTGALLKLGEDAWLPLTRVDRLQCPVQRLDSQRLDPLPTNSHKC